jgi:predicted NBD/HSP70 family sugar kinase
MPTAPQPPLLSRASSQGGLGQYNERVVLQAVRLHGALPAADIARQSRLTAQAVSLISKRLLDEGLLLKCEPQRGKVGQPSVPLRLNPEGAFAIGINLGRRSMDVLLLDFCAQVRQRWQLDYEHADPDVLLHEIGLRLQDIEHQLCAAGRGRVQGIGIAAPLFMDGWQDLLGLPESVAQKWQLLQRQGLAKAVEQLTPWPVTLIKDTAAACVAELVAGRGRSVSSFLYVFVDTFIGGGLVLGSHLHGGINGNAGAVGSLMMNGPKPPSAAVGGPQSSAAVQLLGVASLLTLERQFHQAGLDARAITDQRALQPPWRPYTQAWVDQAALGIAQAVQNATCMLDLEGVIVDGSFGRELLAALLKATTAAASRCNWEGITQPTLMVGTIGSDARALGAALLPLYANFVPDRDLFFSRSI